MFALRNHIGCNTRGFSKVLRAFDCALMTVALFWMWFKSATCKTCSNMLLMFAVKTNVVILFQNILDKFNPGARQMINAGKAYLKALHGKLNVLFS